MTEKSLMLFGKYRDMKVGDVMKTYNGLAYLRWVYFENSMVTFMNDILDKLKITQSWRIEKPGKDVELHKEYKRTHYKRQGYDAEIIKLKRKKTARSKFKGLIERENIYYSKRSLQSRNQGH